MSEKLYELEQIIELFDEGSSVPERSLIFAGPDYSHKVTFQKNRMTLIFNHKLYDWYGREVELEPGIKQVLAHFGCCNGETRAYETFVVERNDDRLAIATLDYKDFQKTTNSNLAKMRTTSWIMVGKPFLSRSCWSFAKFDDSNSRVCLNEINKWLLQKFDYTCKICLHATMDYQELEEDSIVFAKTFQGTRNDRWIRHHIAKSRNTIFDSSRAHLPTIMDTHFIQGDIYGDLEFSQNGRKMTAFTNLPSIGKKRAPISTDIDVIRHTRDFAGIFWYYDPEP